MKTPTKVVRHKEDEFEVVAGTGPMFPACLIKKVHTALNDSQNDLKRGAIVRDHIASC